MKIFRASLFGFFLVFAPLNFACDPETKAGLEKLYCQIKAEGKGKHLPPLSDFRKNTQRVQRLLLQRDAHRLGFKMPSVSPERMPFKKSEDKPRGKSPLAVSGLNACQLQPKAIVCASRIFKLQENRSNWEIPKSALSPGNQMIIPVWNRSSGTQTLQSYLTGAYRIYIDKMMALGLASVSMSYSRFYYSYLDLEEKGVDFPARMKTMYRYLKKDKLSMNASRAHHKVFPKSIRQCMRLSGSIIVCDDAKSNWIYQRS